MTLCSTSWIIYAGQGDSATLFVLVRMERVFTGDPDRGGWGQDVLSSLPLSPRGQGSFLSWAVLGYF